METATMAKKTVVTLEVSALGTADRFTVSVPTTTEPAEAADVAREAIEYVADKGRRALGFLTEDQVLQQREHLEALAASMGGAGMDEPAEGPDDAPEAETEISHGQFWAAIENLAMTLRESGSDQRNYYPMSAALEIVQAELQRTASEPEDKAFADLAEKFGFDASATESYGGPRLSARVARNSLKMVAATYSSGSFPVDGVLEDVRAELNRQVEAGHVVQDTEAEAVPVEDVAAEDVAAEDGKA